MSYSQLRPLQELGLFVEFLNPSGGAAFISTTASLVCCMGKDKITSRVCLGCRVFPYFSPKAESAQENPATASPSAYLPVIPLPSIRIHRGFHQALEFLQKNPFQSSFPVLHAETRDRREAGCSAGTPQSSSGFEGKNNFSQ